MRPYLLGQRTSCVLAAALCAFLTAAAAAPARGSDPVLVVLLVDTSRSIPVDDLAAVRTIAVDLLRSLPPSSLLRAYRFDDRPVLVSQTLDPAALDAALGGLAPRGNRTVLFDAIYDRAKELQAPASQAVRAILVFTDGRDAGSDSKADDVARMAQAANVPVFSVGIGKVKDRDLRRISKVTDGAYQPIAETDGEALARRIQERARTVRSPAPAPPPISAPASPLSTGQTGPEVVWPGHSSPSGAGRIPWLGWAFAGATLLAAITLGVVASLLRRPARRVTTATTPISPSPEMVSPAPIRPPSPELPDLDETVVSPAGILPVVVNRTQLIELGDGTLAVQEGSGAGQVFKVNRKSDTLVGRSNLADIQLPDPAVSQEHCRISARRGFFLLQDLNSTNGTFVNGERVNQHVLRNGDVVRVGETALEFRAVP